MNLLELCLDPVVDLHHRILGGSRNPRGGGLGGNGDFRSGLLREASDLDDGLLCIIGDLRYLVSCGHSSRGVRVRVVIMLVQQLHYLSSQRTLDQRDQDDIQQRRRRRENQGSELYLGRSHLIVTPPEPPKAPRAYRRTSKNRAKA